MSGEIKGLIFTLSALVLVLAMELTASTLQKFRAYDAYEACLDMSSDHTQCDIKE